jgi:threonine dehydratase
VALEIVEQLPGVETVVVPVGGGGLISGIVAGLGAVESKAVVWGVEPIGAPKLHRSLAAGEVVRLDQTGSIADGLITLNVGAIPFAELTRQRERIRGVALVEDESIRAAVHFLWRTCRLAVEPSGAATTAALLDGLVPRGRTTVLVVSGGNVDPTLLEATD